MAILRAGPWGNLSDSYQSVPPSTTVPLTKYPVNIAKTNWPTQTWAVWYELTTTGCCTPETVSITNAYLSSMTRGADCQYSESYAGTPEIGYYDYYIQTLTYNSIDGTWYLYWDSADNFGHTSMTNNDPCDPTGTYYDPNYPGVPFNDVTTP